MSLVETRIVIVEKFIKDEEEFSYIMKFFDSFIYDAKQSRKNKIEKIHPSYFCNSNVNKALEKNGYKIGVITVSGIVMGTLSWGE